ncbi:MAG: prepilin-type N-terminal cleavage/methylation domain-containing protein [Opitutae bacterium]|nr:prepilin-type N-terminal cleavage/methylation domain-containing protein [Opitutae bacterium]
MIISTTPSKRSDAPHGFTLVEVLIALAIGSMVLAGTLSAFLMIGRTSVSVANYSTAEAQIRRSIETLSEDLRASSNILTNNSSSITLTVPDSYAAYGNKVTYAYDNASKCLRQLFYDPATNALVQQFILVRDVDSLAFNRFSRLDTATTSDSETKRIQLTLAVRRKEQTVAAATNSIVSASFILRNKVAN